MAVSLFYANRYFPTARLPANADYLPAPKWSEQKDLNLHARTSYL